MRRPCFFRTDPEIQAAVSHPGATTVPRLKAVARGLGRGRRGTKAALTLKILAHFGLSRPSVVPHCVLNAVRQEKARGEGTGHP